MLRDIRRVAQDCNLAGMPGFSIDRLPALAPTCRLRLRRSLLALWVRRTNSPRRILPRPLLPMARTRARAAASATVRKRARVKREGQARQGQQVLCAVPSAMLPFAAQPQAGEGQLSQAGPGHGVRAVARTATQGHGAAEVACQLSRPAQQLRLKTGHRSPTPVGAHATPVLEDGERWEELPAASAGSASAAAACGHSGDLCYPSDASHTESSKLSPPAEALPQWTGLPLNTQFDAAADARPDAELIGESRPLQDLAVGLHLVSAPAAAHWHRRCGRSGGAIAVGRGQVKQGEAGEERQEAQVEIASPAVGGPHQRMRRGSPRS